MLQQGPFRNTVLAYQSVRIVILLEYNIPEATAALRASAPEDPSALVPAARSAMAT